MRLFVIPTGIKPLGLLFRANKGQVDFDAALGESCEALISLFVRLFFGQVLDLCPMFRPHRLEVLVSHPSLQPPLILLPLPHHLDHHHPNTPQTQTQTGIVHQPPLPSGQLRAVRASDRSLAAAARHIEALKQLGCSYWALNRHPGWTLVLEQPVSHCVFDGSWLVHLCAYVCLSVHLCVCVVACEFVIYVLKKE